MNLHAVFVGAVVLIVGIALSYVAVTSAVCPPEPPFTLNDTVYVFAVHVPVIVAVPLLTPRLALVHATPVAPALKDLLFTDHLLNVYPVAVIAAGIVNVPSYVHDAGLVGAVPRPPFAHFRVMVFAVHFAYNVTVAPLVLVRFVTLAPFEYDVPDPSALVFQPANVHPVRL